MTQEEKVEKLARALAFEYHNGEIVSAIHAAFKGAKTTSAPNEAWRAAEEDWQKWKDKAERLLKELS